jgi:Spy/CpxP family protein refolding chaperone
MSMANQRVRFAILMVLMVPMVVGGTQSQPAPQTSTSLTGAMGSMSVAAVTVITPANPVAELQMFMPQLNLTADQQTKIKAIVTAQQTALTAAEKALTDATTAFRTATDAGNETDIKAGATRIGTGLGNLVALRVKTAAQMRAVLTATQATQLSQLKANQVQMMERTAILNNLQQQTQQVESSVTK